MKTILDFSKKPKIMITTNYTIGGAGSSFEYNLELFRAPGAPKERIYENGSYRPLQDCSIVNFIKSLRTNRLKLS